MHDEFTRYRNNAWYFPTWGITVSILNIMPISSWFSCYCFQVILLLLSHCESFWRLLCSFIIYFKYEFWRLLLFLVDGVEACCAFKLWSSRFGYELIEGGHGYVTFWFYIVTQVLSSESFFFLIEEFFPQLCRGYVTLGLLSYWKLHTLDDLRTGLIVSCL